MAMRAIKAAEKTTILGWRMAISAATRKVLSPISEKRIMVSERTKEWKGCIISLELMSVGLSDLRCSGDATSASSISKDSVARPGEEGGGIS